MSFSKLLAGNMPVSTVVDLATRRAPFKKSKQGCRTCKARKVKCDEERPVCGNCLKRFVSIESCEFDPFVVKAKSKSLGNTVVPLIPCHVTPLPADIQSSGISRNLELRLMHHYAMFTSSQLPGRHDTRGITVWAIDIPRMAFESDLVLDSVLGIAAQHLWTLTPNENSLAYASRRYLDKALSKHRIALAHADQRSAESLLASAILITHHTWIASHALARSEPYVLPLQTYYMARGIQALFLHMFPWLKSSDYLWYAEQIEIKNAAEKEHLTPFMQSGKHDLATLSVKIAQSVLNTDDQLVYHAGLDELFEMYSHVGASRHLIHQRIATMPLRLPPRFLELVEEQKPEALAILARNLALLKMVDSAWWLHGSGEHEVATRAIHGIRELMASEWLWSMEWPIRVVSGNNVSK